MKITDDEMKQLRKLGLRGELRPWGGGGHLGASNVRRFVVVMYHPIAEPVNLPKPKDGDVIYVQTRDGWKKLPEATDTLTRSVRLSYAPPTPQESSAMTKYFEDKGFGPIGTTPSLVLLVLGGPDMRPTAFTWTSAEEGIDPDMGALAPPDKTN